MNKRNKLICSCRLSPITLFPRLARSPGECGNHGDSRRLIRSGPRNWNFSAADRLIALVRQAWDSLTLYKQDGRLKRGGLCEWVFWRLGDVDDK